MTKQEAKELLRELLLPYMKEPSEKDLSAFFYYTHSYEGDVELAKKVQEALDIGFGKE